MTYSDMFHLVIQALLLQLFQSGVGQLHRLLEELGLVDVLFLLLKGPLVILPTGDASRASCLRVLFLLCTGLSLQCLFNV